ncbi:MULTISPECIES: Ppx/GppA family phosphatase [Rhodomicrobium]|uniref:Ppx/GppA family phosphatase n=1 Tax=Rhodomicrobium TaxID=1068 RepID=UPI000B4A5B2A|nr:MULTISPECIES: Ppx/GppA family phosphatase [Rhodomicrobium]
MDWRGTIFTDQAAPVAVVDIGSNSIRLVVYEDEVRSPTPVLNEKVLCGLGRKRTAEGGINKRAAEQALLALRRFRKLSEQTRVKRTFAFATEAVRSASDGRKFIAEAEKALGCTVRVLDGREEAELAAAGIASGFMAPDGFAGDLGGGSLELINLMGKELLDEVSVPLGSLNLMEIAGDDFAKASAHIEKHLDAIPWLEKGKGRPFYLIGGTWRSVAKLNMMETDYPLSIMHHYTMTPKQIDTLFASVVSPKPSAKNLSKISRDRREMLPYGLLLLKRLVDRIKPSEAIFSAYGVREGVLYRNLPPAEQALDPLIFACEEMAARRARSFDYAGELFEWTSGLFQTADLAETAEETRLRRAACMLFDVGWRGHPDYRGEKALGLIAQSSFVGVDHPGRAYLALSVFYSHERAVSGDFSPALRKLAGRNLNRRAQLLGMAARVAYKLSVNMPGIINETTIGYNGGNLVLQLPAKLEVLDGEALRRRFKALAQLVNCEPEIVIEPKRSAAASILRAFVARE